MDIRQLQIVGVVHVQLRHRTTMSISDALSCADARQHHRLKAATGRSGSLLGRGQTQPDLRCRTRSGAKHTDPPRSAIWVRELGEVGRSYASSSNSRFAGSAEPYRQAPGFSEGLRGLRQVYSVVHDLH